MSPIFEPDFTSVDAGIPMYPKARYRLFVKGFKPFAFESKDRKTGNVVETGGIRYSLQMVGRFDDEGNLQTTDAEGVNIKDKAVSPYPVWLRTEGGWSFAKSFLMAAAGFRTKEEDDANKKFFKKWKWSFQMNPGDSEEAANVGNGWEKCVGRMVDVNLAVSTSKNDQTGETYENQEFSGWSPVND